MKSVENTAITPESVLSLIQEMALTFNRELEKSRAERAESEAKFNRDLEKSRAEFKQEMAESRAEFKQRMKNLDDMIGGVGNSNGMAAEELFYNTLDNGDKKIFGEQFDLCHRNLNFHDKKGKKRNEFDIVLVNGKSMALIEVKYKARKEDIQKIIDKVPDFKTYFPLYKDHRLLLGLAALSFDKGVVKDCKNKGIAILKQIDETVLIEDENLMEF
jgi:hypothetical protein